MTFDERVQALTYLGFTPRQTRFLVTVALQSGFCVRRQFAAFAGVAYAGPHLHACIMAVLETGLRKSELLGLTWGDVHADRGIIILPALVTKTKRKARQVIITPRLQAVLAMRASTQRTARELAVGADLPGALHPFGNELGERVKGVKTAWRLTCQRAGIRGVTFHDLRREAASQLFETPDVDLMQVREFLGHDNVQQTNTYLSTSAAKQRAALAKRDAARTTLAQTPIVADGANEAPTVTH